VLWFVNSDAEQRRACQACRDVVHALRVATPSTTTDFGAPPEALTWRVAQIARASALIRKTQFYIEYLSSILFIMSRML